MNEALHSFVSQPPSVTCQFLPTHASPRFGAPQLFFSASHFAFSYVTLRRSTRFVLFCTHAVMLGVTSSHGALPFAPAASACFIVMPGTTARVGGSIASAGPSGDGSSFAPGPGSSERGGRGV